MTQDYKSFRNFLIIISIGYAIFTVLSLFLAYDFCTGDPFYISSILSYIPNLKAMCITGIIQSIIMVLIPIVLIFYYYFYGKRRHYEVI